MLDLSRWGQGPRWYVRALESVLMETLAAFDIAARRYPGRPGVWTGDNKIASIGVRVSRGVTSHGFALNVDTDMSWFEHIVPCGLTGVRMTSMARHLHTPPFIESVTDVLVESFARIFGLAVEDRGEAPAPSDSLLAVAP
jgi:lipoate-protein ligase B